MTRKRLRELALVVWVALLFVGNAGVVSHGQLGVGGGAQQAWRQCNKAPTAAPDSNSPGDGGGGGVDPIKRCRP